MRKGYIFIVMMCIVGLMGCARMICTDPTDCWKGYMNESPCGTFVQPPCENLCLSCTFNEPSCHACWTCLHHDGCGFDGSFCNISRWK